MRPVTSEIDPDVKVPAAVKAAAARAEEIHQSAYKQPDEGGTEEGKEQEAQGEQTDGEGAERAEANGADAPADPPAETPTKEVTSEGTEPKAPPVEKELTAADWEHRYRSMEGRYNRAQQVIDTQNDRITRLEHMLGSVEKAPGKSEPTKVAQPLITQQEIDEYGQEFLDVVGRKAREIAGSEIDQLKAQVGELKSQLGQVGSHVVAGARDRMVATLDDWSERHNVDWRGINRDENFLQWLQLPDAYSGAIRHNLLKDAFERNDSPRVLAFFKGFLAEEAALAPRTKEGPDLGVSPPAESGRQQSPKTPLETFAAPGRAKSAAASNAPTEKPIITRAQISSFYSAVAAGKYRGKEAEKERLEKMIFEAERDGRIQ